MWSYPLVAGSSDPMGTFFCKADSQIVQKLIKIDLGEGSDWTLVASEAGRVNNNSIKLLIEAKNNPDRILLENIIRLEQTLKLTAAGVDVVTHTTKKDGTTVVNKCVYHRKVNSASFFK